MPPIDKTEAGPEDALHGFVTPACIRVFRRTAGTEPAARSAESNMHCNGWPSRRGGVGRPADHHTVRFRVKGSMVPICCPAAFRSFTGAMRGIVNACRIAMATPTAGFEK